MNKKVQELFLELIDIALKNISNEKNVNIELRTSTGNIEITYFAKGKCETDRVSLGLSEKITIEELKTEKDKMLAFLEVKNTFYTLIETLNKTISDMTNANMKIYDTENPDYMIDKIYYDELVDKICVNFKEDK